MLFLVLQFDFYTHHRFATRWQRWKIATGINDTSGPGEKFAASVIDTRGKFATGVAEFAYGVSDAGGAPWLADIAANFRKIFVLNLSYLQGLGEDDSWKKPEAKHLVTLSLL